MAVPKRKTSKSRKGMRRSHRALKATQISYCPNCNSPKLPHRICGNCGYYRGESVIET